MSLVEVMAIVSAGTVLLAWKVYKMYMIIDAFETALFDLEEGVSEKLNEVIDQCNSNTVSIERIRKQKTRTKKNDGLETQG